MAEWLVPFKGRNPSGPYNQNFLWRDENVYIMDNHRAALWCWIQHMEKDEPVNFLHIDRHRDTLYSRIDHWVQICPDLRALAIKDYLSYRGPNQSVPLFRWDNYASIFLELCGPTIEQAVFATHGDGDKPRHARMQEVPPWELPGNLHYWLMDGKAPWICNVDLDYFVYLTGQGSGSEAGSSPDNEDDPNEPTVSDVEDEDEARPRELFSNAYFSELFTAIRQELYAGKIKVLTLCLSPECSGGWGQSEALCRKACAALGIEFSLPSSE